MPSARVTRVTSDHVIQRIFVDLGTSTQRQSVAKSGRQRNESKALPGLPRPHPSSCSPRKKCLEVGHTLWPRSHNQRREKTGWRAVCPLPRLDVIFLNPENEDFSPTLRWQEATKFRETSLFHPPQLALSSTGRLQLATASLALVQPELSALMHRGAHVPSGWPSVVAQLRASLCYACPEQRSLRAAGKCPQFLPLVALLLPHQWNPDLGRAGLGSWGLGPCSSRPCLVRQGLVGQQ